MNKQKLTNPSRRFWIEGMIIGMNEKTWQFTKTGWLKNYSLSQGLKRWFWQGSDFPWVRPLRYLEVNVLDRAHTYHSEDGSTGCSVGLHFAFSTLSSYCTDFPVRLSKNRVNLPRNDHCLQKKIDLPRYPNQTWSPSFSWELNERLLVRPGDEAGKSKRQPNNPCTVTTQPLLCVQHGRKKSDVRLSRRENNFSPNDKPKIHYYVPVWGQSQKY